MYKRSFFIFFTVENFIIPKLGNITLRCFFNNFQFNGTAHLFTAGIYQFAFPLFYWCIFSTYKTIINISHPLHQHCICRNHFFIAENDMVTFLQLRNRNIFFYTIIYQRNSQGEIRTIVPVE